MSNTFVWVDIPVLDLDRAIAFYGAILGKAVDKVEGPGFTFGLFKHEGNEVGGCLFLPEGDVKPSLHGPLVYLDATGRLDAAIDAAGARITAGDVYINISREQAIFIADHCRPGGDADLRQITQWQLPLTASTESPAAHTSFADKAVTAQRTSLLAGEVLGLRTRLQLLPSQCKVSGCCAENPTWMYPTAQMSLAATAAIP